jgi:predicted permease
MSNIIEIVLPTFMVIAIGYLIGKFAKINIAPVADINLYVAVPALVLVSMLNQKIILLDAAKIWAASITIILGCLLLAWLVFKVLKQKHSGLYVSIAVMNTVNIPFPIIFLAYGAVGMTAATLFYIPGCISAYSLGIFIMAGKKWRDNIKEVAKQPAVYAAILGLLFNLYNVHVPELIHNTLDFVSKMAIPLILLVLGCNLAKVRIASVPTTLLASFLRVGIGLALGLLVVHVFNITGVYRSVVILDSAMPAAAVSSLMATKYNNEAELVSSVVFLTTVASLVIIPLLLHVLG